IVVIPSPLIRRSWGVVNCAQLTVVSFRYRLLVETNQPPTIFGRNDMRRKRMSFCPPGRWSRKRGKKNEKRVLRAIQRDPPDFVRSVRLATKEEDAYGIDIVIETYSSDVPVL